LQWKYEIIIHVVPPSISKLWSNFLTAGNSSLKYGERRESERKIGIISGMTSPDICPLVKMHQCVSQVFLGIGGRVGAGLEAFPTAI
jgi:hypothetical protein